MEMKIAFLDHAFHEKTKSSFFFADLLRLVADVDVYYFDCHSVRVVEEICETDYDVYVLWQTEFFAPYFLLRGKRVVVVPMYDGCGNMPRKYWQLLSQARVLNFSQALAHRHTSLGIDQLHVQYFPDPAEYEVVQDFSSMRGFFVQRRPRELDCEMIADKAGHFLDQLHVHNVPDEGDPDLHRVPSRFSESRWFSNKAEYEEVRSRSNIFFAPRLTEGIGMATLEAMAMGMCVICPDFPTANEYIDHKYNGLLFDANSGDKIQVNRSLIPHIALNARETVERGYEKWERSIRDIQWFVCTAPAPVLSKKIKGTDLEAALNLALCFYTAPAAYPRKGQRLRHKLINTLDREDFHSLKRLRDFINGALKSIVHKPLSKIKRKRFSAAEPCGTATVSFDVVGKSRGDRKRLVA